MMQCSKYSIRGRGLMGNLIHTHLNHGQMYVHVDIGKKMEEYFDEGFTVNFVFIITDFPASISNKFMLLS